ncbi:DMT family transporter [Neogemmobacter tilapiae]|uniref:Membrane protein n=1 Tax=Neogemmobacter tilapiae TaxID=875041 RepID=A0A918TR89_9RHOB|nr:DMT family transporter [Gemmobacter tilapiae]GHC53232.1 membrane protein [Gemmobacter tilapiae]
MTPNLRGALFMVLAMAGFAIEDSLLKGATARGVPVGQVLVMFGGTGMLVFAALARAQGDRVLHPAILTRPLLVRAVFEVMGRLFFTLSLALTSLSATSAILQAAPLMVIAGAAVIFGERVSPARWLAVLLGFIGVLIILRPGLEGFTPLSILAVLGMIGFAGRDLATRAAPKILSNFQLGIYGFAMMVPAGFGMLIWKGGAIWPDATALAYLAAAVGVGVAAYNFLTVAMRTGDVSAVTPFRYTRLVFAMVLGAAVFGERPDLLTLLGSVIVVGAGIFALTIRR